MHQIFNKSQPYIQPWNCPAQQVQPVEFNQSQQSQQNQPKKIFSEHVEKPFEQITLKVMTDFEKEINLRENNNMMTHGRVFGANTKSNSSVDMFVNILQLSEENIMEMMTSQNINLNATDFWGNNLLISLSLAKKPDILQKIIGCCLQNFSEKTIYDFVIHLASSVLVTYPESFRIKLIELLLAKIDGKILNKQDNYGNSVITHCLALPSVLDVFLTNKNIDLEISNFCGNTAISYCVQNNNLQSLEKLITFMKLNYTTEKMTKILNMKNMLTESPFLIAIKTGNLSIVKTLLDTQLVDINVVSFDGKSSLLLSIEKNMTDICEVLLNSNSVDYNLSDNFGNTPIMKAIELKNYKIVFALLNKHVNLNHTNSIRQTPLLQSLLAKYKLPKPLESTNNCPNSFGLCEGFEGFQKIAYDDYPSCFKSIVNNFSSNIELPNSSSQIFDVIASKLIESHLSDINASDLQGNTPFMLICENNDTFLFNKLMANNNFDPYSKNSKGISCFEYIKEKHDSLLCKMFGNSNYCPVTGQLTTTSIPTSTPKCTTSIGKPFYAPVGNPCVDLVNNITEPYVSNQNVIYTTEPIKNTTRPTHINFNVKNPIKQLNQLNQVNQLNQPTQSIRSGDPYNDFYNSNCTHDSNFTYDGDVVTDDIFESEPIENFNNYNSDSEESNHSANSLNSNQKNSLDNIVGKIIKIISESDFEISAELRKNPDELFKKMYELTNKVKDSIDSESENNKPSHCCMMNQFDDTPIYSPCLSRRPTDGLNNIMLMKYATIKYFYNEIMKKINQSKK